MNWLTPPDSLGEITVGDITSSHGPQEHEERIIAWAKSVWNAWKAYHSQIKEVASTLKSEM